MHISQSCDKLLIENLILAILGLWTRVALNMQSSLHLLYAWILLIEAGQMNVWEILCQAPKRPKILLLFFYWNSYIDCTHDGNELQPYNFYYLLYSNSYARCERFDYFLVHYSSKSNNSGKKFKFFVLHFCFEIIYCKSFLTTKHNASQHSMWI